MIFKTIAGLLLLALANSGQVQLPDGFVYLNKIDTSIKVELRYYSTENFVGDTIEGYLSNKCILSKASALALKQVQNELHGKNLSLKVFDAYRPQRAVNHFVVWAKDLNDTLQKDTYYPQINKKDLFKKGYIASKSGHSRGSTVDVTLVSTKGASKGAELDMGTTWDYFGKESWPSNTNLSEEQIENRQLLRTLMLKHGFKPLRTEWWHFTLKNEPFPNSYFDFDIK